MLIGVYYKVVFYLLCFLIFKCYNLKSVYNLSLHPQEIDKNVFEILAYADDIAIICKSKDELLKAMDIIDKWCLKNDVRINKKKSGILILQNDSIYDKDINGYPLQNQYKYLGIMINSSIDPSNHIYETNKKLALYLKRNQWLMRSYFTPRSLLLLANYYQMSRLSYGMCVFLDNDKIMDNLEKARMKYCRSIIGLKENIKSNLLRLTLCLPKVEYLLFNRLLNVIEKYTEHFKEVPYVFALIVHEFYHKFLFYYSLTKISDLKQQKLY